MSRRPVLITGCSDGGLGALALAFHKAGYRVLASARNPSKMASLKAAGIETLALDVLSEESVQACVAEVTNLTGGALYALVNNAGGKNASVKSGVV
jgi:1-acylglycerone phosphate reductase